MKKIKLTRAMKREVTTRLFKERSRFYESKYREQKGVEAMREYYNLQDNLNDGILKIIDEGVTSHDLCQMLKIHGFRDFEDRFTTHDLLSDYSEELEVLYPDYLVFDPEVREYAKELK